MDFAFISASTFCGFQKAFCEYFLLDLFVSGGATLEAESDSELEENRRLPAAKTRRRSDFDIIEACQ